MAWWTSRVRGARAAFLMKRNHRERGKRNGDPETRRRRNHLESWFHCQGVVDEETQRFTHVSGFIVDEKNDHDFGIYPSVLINLDFI